MSEERPKSWTEYFRVITPVLVTIAIFQLGQLNATVSKLDDKVFKHLTNEEIHTPRESVVTKREYDLYCKLADKNMDTILDEINKLRNILEKKANLH